MANIQEVLKAGGIGYRISCEAAHRGSHKDGFIDVRFFLANGKLSPDDLLADDWIPMENKVLVSASDVFEATSKASKELFMNAVYKTAEGMRSEYIQAQLLGKTANLLIKKLGLIPGAKNGKDV